MTPASQFARTWSMAQSRMSNRWRSSSRWFRIRHRQRLAVPPATPVVAESLNNGVFEIHLAGGDRRNVLGRSTIDQIEQLVATPPKGTKVIAITADAPDFCAGYDIIEASRGEPEELIANEKNFAALRHSKVPLIAALHGNVIGGGLELALLADVRVASPETKMAIPASRIGLVYSEAGIRLVVTTLGESVARSLFLGGRELTAEAALSLGVVSEVVGRDQLRERTLELAASMASWSEVASSGNRQIIDSITRDASIDIDALRREAFAPHGGLRHYIAQFVARRANAPGGLVH